MKNVKNKLIFVLTSAILAVGLTVGASAQTIVVGAPGTGSSASWSAILSKAGSSDCPVVSASSDCPSDSSLKSLLGDLGTICPPGQVTDSTQLFTTGTDAAEASQSCPNTAVQGATSNVVKPSAPKSQSAVSSSSCPATVDKQSGNSAVSAAEKAAASVKAATVSKTTEKQAATQAAATSQTTAQESAAEPESAAQDSSAPAAASADTSTTCPVTGQQTASDASTSQVSGNTLVQYINRLLKKCGIDLNALGINLPGCANTPASVPASAETGTAAQPADTTDQTSAAPSGNTAAETPKQNSTTPSGSSQTTPATPSSGQSSAGSSNSQKADNLSFEEQVVALVNEQRAANGLQPVTLSTALSNAARVKSQDMHDNHYFAHESPTYGSPFEMLTSFGISYRAAGENIAMGYATPEAVMNAWMNSPGHRANILNASYTQIGVGYVADGNYWTQEFTG